MNWKVVCLLSAVLVCFGFPMLSGIKLPKDFSAEQVGEFLGQIVAYWIDVFTYILRRAGFQFFLF
jgi:hypothetical protein